MMFTAPPLHTTTSSRESPSHLAESLIQVGSELFTKGYEPDAMASFDLAFTLLQAASEPIYSSAIKHISQGTQLLLSDTTQSGEEQNLPDLYQEDECDVGPRVIRTTVRPACFDTIYLEAVLCYNKALIYHDNLDFTEAKRLYQLVLHALQGLLLGHHIPSLQLLELGTRAHNNIGHICYLGGDEDLARAHFEASLMCARQLADVTKEYRLEYATVLSNWCRVSWMRGDISDNLYNGLREVLRIRSALLRYDHIDVAAAHYNIGVAEYARRRNQKAISHLMQYLHVASKRAESNQDDLDSIPALIYLLLIQTEDKDDSMSQELVRGLRTLQDKRQDQGPDSPEVASVLNFIGTLLFHKEDFENALLFFQEELRLEENMPESTDDISVSVTCNNIGRILQELGKLNEAVHYYQQALRPEYGDISCLRITKGSTPCSLKPKSTSNPSSANLYSTVWYNLGLIHDKLGAYADAIGAFEMSLELRRSMLGNDHPDIACLLYNIGVLQMEQQQLSEASNSFREALRIRRRGAAGQLNDKHVVKTLEKLSSLYKTKGNVKGALEASQEVLCIQEHSADYDRESRLRETGVTLRSMAELNHATGDLNQALQLSTQSVQKLRLIFTSSLSASVADCLYITEQLVSSLLLVGSLYHELCEPLDATVILREASDTIARARAQHVLSSLDALQEVTSMLAALHCAAQA